MSTATVQRLGAVRRDPGVIFGAVIAVVAFAGSLALLGHGGIAPSDPGSRVLDPIGVVLVACSTLPLLVWRRSPPGVFLATATASVLLAGLRYPADLMLGPTIALYLLTLSRDEENPWTFRTTVAVAVTFVAYLGATAAAQRSQPGIELLHTGLAWSVAWFAGERKRRQSDEQNESALRAEREAERERLLAVAEERARIARDLHDSAGHAISVIAVRAGAARLRHGRDPSLSFEALAEVEELARKTVAEIDEIVGTLRKGDPAHGAVEAPIGLASLRTLIADQAAAGLDVELETSGAPQSLRGAVDGAAYRILQEALTNAARYGEGDAHVKLNFGDAELEIAILNRARVDGLPRPGGGHGLVGIRERALSLGGSVHAERSDGMFSLRARLPYGGRGA